MGSTTAITKPTICTTTTTITTTATTITTTTTKPKIHLLLTPF